jgi:hypothetical protein
MKIPTNGEILHHIRDAKIAQTPKQNDFITVNG